MINSCTASLPDSFVGSAVIYSDQPIVVVANQSNPSKMTECLFNGISGTEGDVQLFFPIVQNNYLGWFSSFTVQNMGVSQDQGDFEYRPDCTSACGWESPLSSAAINPDYGYMFTPVASSFSGYGIFTSLQPEPFGSVVRVWNENAMTSYCHNGFGGGTTFPVPERNTWFLPWVNAASRIVVKNTNDSTGRTVNVNWQGIAGQQTLNLAANDKQVIIPAVPGGWSGSGVVQSIGGDLPLAIVVQNAQAGGNDYGAYNVYGENHGALQLFIPHVAKAQQFLPTIWKFYNPAILQGAEK